MNKQTASAAHDAVTLILGATVPLAVLRFAWALEARGVALRVEADVLCARPASLLSETEIAFLRRYRRELIELVDYCDSAPARRM